MIIHHENRRCGCRYAVTQVVLSLSDRDWSVSGPVLESRSPCREAAHADELCRRSPPDHPPRGGGRRGRGGRGGGLRCLRRTGCVQVVDAYGRIVTQCN